MWWPHRGRRLNGSERFYGTRLSKEPRKLPLTALHIYGVPLVHFWIFFIHARQPLHIPLQPSAWVFVLEMIDGRYVMSKYGTRRGVYEDELSLVVVLNVSFLGGGTVWSKLLESSNAWRIRL